MRIAWSMVLAVFFLMWFIHADVSTMSTEASRGGGPAAVGKTFNPAESSEVPAEKTLKSQFVPQMKTQDVIQPEQQMIPVEALHFRNPRDGYEMILIPRGEAIFNTGPDDPYFGERFTDREKPQFRVDISEFYMGIYVCYQ